MSGDWTEQTHELMRSWSFAQAKLWDSWAPAGAEAPEDPAKGSPDWVTQWQEAVRRNPGTLADGVQGAPRELIERLFAAECVYLKFVDACVQAMKSLAPRLQAGEDWAELLKRSIGQMRDDVTAGRVSWVTAAGAAAVGRDIPELWRLYTAEIQKLVVPWTESLGDAHRHPGQAASGGSHAAIQMLNIFTDTFGSTLGKFAAAPAVGSSRQFQQELTEAFEAWVEVRRAEVEFQTEILNTGFRSLEHLVGRLVDLGDRGEKVTSYRQLFDLWIDTAEKAFREVASTDPFAEAQGRLVNAAMHYRIHERRVVEEGLRALHLPTRQEVDDAYKRMAVMRREIKALRREVDELRSGLSGVRPSDPAPAEPQGPGPARRRAPAARSKKGA